MRISLAREVDALRTGGKNFHLCVWPFRVVADARSLHSSAEVKSAVLQTIRASFEFQGK